MLLYKPYNISLLSSSRITPPDIQMLHNKINNLEKTLKTIQSSVKIILFLPPINYKTIQTNEEKKKKPIKIYIGDLLCEPFFIADSVQEQLIIELTKRWW